MEAESAFVITFSGQVIVHRDGHWSRGPFSISLRKDGNEDEDGGKTCG